jgi:hypothetical protein
LYSHILQVPNVCSIYGQELIPYVNLHAKDPHFFLHISLSLAEVDMLKFCMQYLAENISRLNKRLNFALLLNLHEAGCVSIRSGVNLNLKI